jgi:hypothetical protein
MEHFADVETSFLLLNPEPIVVPDPQNHTGEDELTQWIIKWKNEDATEEIARPHEPSYDCGSRRRLTSSGRPKLFAAIQSSYHRSVKQG